MINSGSGIRLSGRVMLVEYDLVNKVEDARLAHEISEVFTGKAAIAATTAGIAGQLAQNRKTDLSDRCRSECAPLRILRIMKYTRCTQVELVIE